MSGRHGTRSRRGTWWAVVRLTTRLTRRSTLLTALALAGYAAIEMSVIAQTYPDDASRAALMAIGDFPALRVLQGIPYSSETGALVAWDAGWVMSLIVGTWAITTTARILRGDEDAGRAEIVLARPVRASHLLLGQVATLLTACTVVGLAAGLGLAASGAPVTGSLLFGASLWAVAAAFVGLTVLTSQVFDSRSRALGAGAALLGTALVLRMVANSADSRSWIAWVTPLGWFDHLQPFGDDRALVLLVPVGVVTVLVAAAVAHRVSRDSRAGLVPQRGDRASRSWGLSSPAAFAWRAGLGSTLSWAAGLTVWGLATGALVPTMEEFVASDPSFVEILSAMGMKVSDLSLGYLGMVATISGVALSIHAATRIGAARAEESSTRLDNITARAVTRRSWLAGHLLLTLASVILLACLTGLATWTGAAVMGSDLGLGDAMSAVLNTVPAAIVFGGLAVLVLGLAPRGTAVVAATAAVIAYVLQIVGPALDWPDAVVGASPFWHLAAVPVEAFEPTSAGVLVIIGAVAAVVGMVAFERRDLVGA